MGIEGGSLEGVARIRLGRGVVGNTTYAIIAFMLCSAIAVTALRSEPYLALAAIALFGAVFVIYLLGTWRFAEKNPALAMLGDSEWLKYHQSQMGAQGVQEIPHMPPGPENHRTIVHQDEGAS